MNSSLLRLGRNGFCRALIIAVLASTVPLKNGRTIADASYMSLPASASGMHSPARLRALSYSISGFPIIAVHLENPQMKR